MRRAYLAAKRTGRYHKYFYGHQITTNRNWNGLKIKTKTLFVNHPPGKYVTQNRLCPYQNDLIITCVPKNGALQTWNYSPCKIQQQFFSKYPSLDGHHWQQRVYDSLRRDFCDTNVARKGYCAVRNSHRSSLSGHCRCAKVHFSYFLYHYHCSPLRWAP